MTFDLGDFHKVVKACVQLWDWVGEQRDIRHYPNGYYADKEICQYSKGATGAYANVRLYMRKFFSGLIDFDEG